MTGIKTILEPPILRYGRGLAEGGSRGTAPFRSLRALASLCLAAMLVGCGSYVAGARDLVQDKSMVAVSIGAVGHYGSGIGVPSYSINGLPVGLSYGWGGGALAGVACLYRATWTSLSW